MSADTPYDRLRHFLPEGDEVGLDGYRVLHPIGEGGFGRVFKARQLAFDRDVAIKVLSATGFQEDTARRFERECRAVGALSAHPHIVTIYDSGITPWGRPYIVMEHMSGGSLAARVDAHGPLEAGEALDILIKISGAVAVAHRNGILHRDIKPENLLVSDYGEPVLADFGVASIPGGYQTHTGAITASLAHAAPEVLDGARATEATDVYSLGSTLFTLLTGHAAFESPDQPGLQALIARTMTQPVPDLRARGVPDGVCVAIETAMAKKPADRFADVAGFTAALQGAQVELGLALTEMLLPDTVVDIQKVEAPFVGERPTVMRHREVLMPPSPPVPRKRPVWRSPVAAAGVTLLLALGAGGTIALNVRRPAGSAAKQATGVVPPPASSPEPVADDRETRIRDTRKARKQQAPKSKRDRRPRDGGTIAFAGGTVSGAGGGGSAGAGAGTPSSSADTYTDDAGGTPTSTGGDGGGGSAGEPTGGGERQPPPPPPANLLLYHLYDDDGDYYFTSSDSELNQKRFDYDYTHREAAVWQTGTQKMRRVCFGDGRCGGWVYIQKPAGIQTRPLYAFTGPNGDYYTTDKAEIPSQYSGYRVYLFGYAQ